MHLNCLNLKLLGGIFEFKITTVKIFFLDKHLRHILQSQKARKNNRCLLLKSPKINKIKEICRFLESVSSDHNCCRFYIRQYFKLLGILDLCFDHKIKLIMSESIIIMSIFYFLLKNYEYKDNFKKTRKKQGAI